MKPTVKQSFDGKQAYRKKKFCTNYNVTIYDEPTTLVASKQDYTFFRMIQEGTLPSDFFNIKNKNVDSCEENHQSTVINVIT